MDRITLRCATAVIANFLTEMKPFIDTTDIPEWSEFSRQVGLCGFLYTYLFVKSNNHQQTMDDCEEAFKLVFESLGLNRVYPFNKGEDEYLNNNTKQVLYSSEHQPERVAFIRRYAGEPILLFNLIRDMENNETNSVSV